MAELLKIFIKLHPKMCVYHRLVSQHSKNYFAIKIIHRNWKFSAILLRLMYIIKYTQERRLFHEFLNKRACFLDVEKMLREGKGEEERKNLHKQYANEEAIKFTLETLAKTPPSFHRRHSVCVYEWKKRWGKFEIFSQVRWHFFLVFRDVFQWKYDGKSSSGTAWN